MANVLHVATICHMVMHLLRFDCRLAGNHSTTVWARSAYLSNLFYLRNLQGRQRAERRVVQELARRTQSQAYGLNKECLQVGLRKGGIMDGTNFELVGDFMESMDQEVQLSPEFPEEHIQRLRINLIEEELDELQLAVDNEDMVEIADALTDLLYVVYGAGHAFGIDLDDCFHEVHRSNLSKLGEDFKPIKREDGKVMKPDTYSPPDLKSVLAI